MNKLWQKAQGFAADARLLHQAKRYDSACNRAYYAMFNAARALLQTREVAAADAKRHSTVWRQFSLHFVSIGSFAMPEGLALTRVGEIRNVADYSETTATEAVAVSVIAAMEKFMATAEPLLEGDTGESHD